MTTNDQIVPYAPIIIKLLQGVIYQEDATPWDLLLHHQSAVRDHFAKIGLALYLDEAEGYAFLHQPDNPEAEIQVPRLTYRYKLSYNLTVLIVLLRERLQEFEKSSPDSLYLILRPTDIYELLRPFLKKYKDEVRQQRQFDSLIKQATDLGFLKPLRSQDTSYYEVQRIIKAKVPADQLAAMKAELEAYVTASR